LPSRQKRKREKDFKKGDSPRGVNIVKQKKKKRGKNNLVLRGEYEKGKRRRE